MRTIVSILFIIWAIVAFMLNLFYIGQLVVSYVIASPSAWSYFCAFIWLSTLMFFTANVDSVLSDINEKQR